MNDRATTSPRIRALSARHLAERPVEATGTVLRSPAVVPLGRYGRLGGFEVLPIDNPLWRFYRMYG